MFRFMRDERREIPSHNAVPCRVEQPLELLSDVRGDIFFDGEFVQRCSGYLYGLVLHLFAHVCVLYDLLALFWVHFKFNIACK